MNDPSYRNRQTARKLSTVFDIYNNGESGEIDLTDELWGEVFEPLKNPALFQTAHQDELMQTVVWANGADFAPEFLMEIMNKQNQQAA
ncbi:MAG: hypothetical protein WC742_00895 [Gallionellaceae bacterium]